jgi:hypothetical protein
MSWALSPPLTSLLGARHHVGGMRCEEDSASYLIRQFLASLDSGVATNRRRIRSYSLSNEGAFGTL